MLEKNRIKPSNYLVQVNINEAEKKKLESLSKKAWLELLNNDSTDWAANLLLYEFYEKDAIEFLNVIKTRKAWIALKKTEDIAYWTVHIH